jgi:mRNA interferase RelE/StbE
MVYQVLLKRSAEKELDSLPKDLRQRIIKRLLALEENARPDGVRKLQGEEAYRIRVGDYRVLYTVDDIDHLVTVYAIGHRREVYR